MAQELQKIPQQQEAWQAVNQPEPPDKKFGFKNKLAGAWRLLQTGARNARGAFTGEKVGEKEQNANFIPTFDQSLAMLSTTGQNLTEILKNSNFSLERSYVAGVDDKNNIIRNDTFNFYIESTVPQHLIASLMSDVKKNWMMIRESANDQTISVIFVNSLVTQRLRIRSCAVMRHNPCLIIECGENGLDDTLRHETVHAVFGAESTGSNAPVAIDYAEGCAMRLVHERPSNDPALQLDANTVDWMKLGLNTGELAASSTTILGIIKEKSLLLPQTEVYLRDATPYQFGYFLVDTLLENKRYLALTVMKMAEQTIPLRTKYSWLLYIHRLYEAAAMKLIKQGRMSNRAAFAEVFVQRLEFPADAVVGLLETIAQKIKNHSNSPKKS